MSLVLLLSLELLASSNQKLTCERFEAKVSLAFFGLFFCFLLTSAPTLPIRREIAGFSWHRNIPTLADETSPISDGGPKSDWP